MGSQYTLVVKYGKVFQNYPCYLFLSVALRDACTYYPNPNQPTVKILEIGMPKIITVNCFCHKAGDLDMFC